MDDWAEFRRIWRRNWLGCLQEFADGDLQERMWLDPQNRNPHWSYVEFMCCYFNDALCGEGYDWAIARGLVTHPEAATVARLHQLLQSHAAPGGNDYDHKTILEHEQWRRIVDEAKTSNVNLAALLADSAERDLLLSRATRDQARDPVTGPGGILNG